MDTSNPTLPVIAGRLRGRRGASQDAARTWGLLQVRGNELLGERRETKKTGAIAGWPAPRVAVAPRAANQRKDALLPSLRPYNT